MSPLRLAACVVMAAALVAPARAQSLHDIQKQAAAAEQARRAAVENTDTTRTAMRASLVAAHSRYLVAAITSLQHQGVAFSTAGTRNEAARLIRQFPGANPLKAEPVEGTDLVTLLGNPKLPGWRLVYAPDALVDRVQHQPTGLSMRGTMQFAADGSCQYEVTGANGRQQTFPCAEFLARGAAPVAAQTERDVRDALLQQAARRVD